ncbi:hypothetical protein E8E11_010209 [Didymella keratinophila]|nr:hypothetical protein E8E11_010209 [Didymella keratinophila]
MVCLDGLPLELLRRVCEFAVPQGLTFSFDSLDGGNDADGKWSLHVAEGNSTPVSVASHRAIRCYMMEGRPHGAARLWNHDLVDQVQTALLYVNKVIAAEARAVLFYGNIFTFRISAQAHRPVSLRSNLIFGPFGKAHRIHFLQDLGQIRLEIIIDEN